MWALVVVVEYLQTSIIKNCPADIVRHFLQHVPSTLSEWRPISPGTCAVAAVGLLLHPWFIEDAEGVSIVPTTTWAFSSNGR